MATVVTQKELNDKFEGLKTIFKNIKSNKGVDLYSHLQEVMKKLILHYPDNALEKLEEVSYLLKNADTHDMEKFLKVSDMRNYKDVCSAMEGYIATMKGIFGGKKAPAEGEEEEAPEEVPPVGFVPDLLADASIYQWAGIGFGQQELYRLQRSMKKLAGDSGAAKLRFFGKIRGTDNDYYVVEGEVEGGDEEGAEGEEKPADFEAKGSGVNKFTYFVSHQSFDKWTKLPDLLPKDVDAARSIKVLLTGDLERTIFTNPFFFGKEKHFLRAQIARISHSTTLCPKGLFRLQEDSTKEIEENAPEEGDIVMPTTSAMASADMWCHHSVGILKNNRTTHMEPEVPEGEEIEPEELMRRIEAKDPYEPRLKSICDDNNVCVSKNKKINPWVVRMCGDSTEYKSDSGKTVCNGVVVARSLQWPGAFNFYHNGQYSQVYVGNALKYEEVQFFPVNPPTVLADPKEYDIQPEPTPLEEPVAAKIEEPKEGEGEGGEE